MPRGERFSFGNKPCMMKWLAPACAISLMKPHSRLVVADQGSVSPQPTLAIPDIAPRIDPNPKLRILSVLQLRMRNVITIKTFFTIAD